MNIKGFVGSQGVGIRRYRIAVPSVGCVNHALERSARIDPALRILTHQNGCGMLQDDVEQIRATLAGILANPNVERGLVVGLGCESNQSSNVEVIARAQSAIVSAVVLQDFGGVEATANEIIRQLSPGHQPLERVPVPVTAIRVVVLLRDDAGAAGEDCLAALVSAMHVEGFEMMGPVLTSVAGIAAKAGLGVPQVWGDEDRSHAPTDVEALSVAAAQGAVLGVSIAGEAGPIGSPVMPVIRITTFPDWAHTSDYVWKPDHPAGMQELLSLLEEVSNGRLTLGEALGQRDFAPPRVSPTM